MAGVTAKIPMTSRILMCENYHFEHSDDSAMNLSDTVFEFLEENIEGSLESTGSHHNGYNEGIAEDEDEEKENIRNVEDDETFWESQNQLLHDILCRTSSLESRVRNATKQALKEAQNTGNFCACRRPVAAGGCRNCLMREICGCLQNSDLKSSICKTKWRGSPDIPSGEHTFVDVMDNSSSKKGEVRVIIEPNFRAEFEVARASEEYNKLIRKLPEVFVGKVERLQSLIKILCSAAKKCMKENKMHMAPWRKQKYMQAKWLSTCERTSSTTPLPTGRSGRATRPRSSMLTVDLLGNLPNLHRTAVKVL